MKIIKPYARLIAPWAFMGAGGTVDMGTPLDEETESPEDVGRDALQFIEWCARISHRSEEAQKDDSFTRFLKNVVIEHGDWSVVEHVSVSVDAVVDRGITHEWVRHRLFSYTQESTRFVNYEKKMPPAFIYPQVGVECPDCLVGDDPDWSINGDNHHHEKGGHATKHWPCFYDSDWRDAILWAEERYKRLLAKGWRPQEARSVFPNALASRIISTTNLRCWRHQLIMRTSAEAHPQMRQVTIPLLAEFKKTFPILFDDIIPNEKQAIAMRKAQ
jgi:thymidylate synthase (FAD)